MHMGARYETLRTCGLKEPPCDAPCDPPGEPPCGPPCDAPGDPPSDAPEGAPLTAHSLQASITLQLYEVHNAKYLLRALARCG